MVWSHRDSRLVIDQLSSKKHSFSLFSNCLKSELLMVSSSPHSFIFYVAPNNNLNLAADRVTCTEIIFFKSKQFQFAFFPDIQAGL